MQGSVPTSDVTRLREEMDAMEKKGALTDDLRARTQLAALESGNAAPQAKEESDP